MSSSDSRAIAFCETKFAGRVADASKLETPLDQLFVAQINHELNAYLEAMEKTKSIFWGQAQFVVTRFV